MSLKISNQSLLLGLMAAAAGWWLFARNPDSTDTMAPVASPAALPPPAPAPVTDVAPATVAAAAGQPTWVPAIAPGFTPPPIPAGQDGATIVDPATLPAGAVACVQFQRSDGTAWVVLYQVTNPDGSLAWYVNDTNGATAQVNEARVNAAVALAQQEIDAGLTSTT
jgi:hypothetical protein